ncbi:transcription factor C6 AmyR like protein [Acrodontium crateriforme]|uniref:Transcription factor C6 AmyR like protein n=1 Tax=Acrodontium crateriforme TaxID=150365 RepID=A0AAQ3RAC6_9PEZI|nr:transcription factor C6 AmyR like protein [Acrodontium crateriforme]
MFAVLDSAVGGMKTAASKACDNCNLRKVRCDMGQPCVTCAARGFVCTYERARKSRGPTGKRISKIRQRQANSVAELEGEKRATQVGSSVHGSQENFDSRYSATLGLQPGADSLASHNSSLAAVRQINDENTSWPTSTPGTNGDHTSPFTSTYPNILSPNRHVSNATTIYSNSAEPGNGTNALTASPSLSEFVFPSMPMDSPSASFDAFGALPQQYLPPLAETVDVWPSNINEETLLPWIDVYFKRLHPTVPILNRTNMYHEMLLRKHRSDSQYGAMLLSLCAFAMTQPVQIHERAAGPSRSAQADMLLEKCVKMRVAADFGEDPTMEMILSSFFLFACLFGSNKHRAARLRLREAVDLAYSLGIHLPESYEGMSAEKREQWLRTYLVLSVTERAYAIQQRHSINFRGRPGITARFMQSFDPTSANEYITSLIYADQTSAVEMTGLLYLMETFDAINESVIDCWNGHCHYSDGICASFDRRRALQMFHAQHRAREACLTGTTSFAPSATPLPLAKLVESQQADISITQFWLLNRLWNLCLSHGLLREISEHAELRFDFACQIGKVLLHTSKNLSLSAMEVHGVGLIEKVHDVAVGIITAMNSSTQIFLDTILRQDDADDLLANRSDGPDKYEMTVRQVLAGLAALIRDFRGGDHIYHTRIAATLAMIPGWEGN